MSVVLGFLGISAFAKDEKGKSIFLSTQEEQLRQKYGDVFVETFKKDLSEFEKDGKNAESVVTEEVKAQLQEDLSKNTEELMATRKALKELKEQVKKQADRLSEKDAQLEKLTKEAAPDAGQK